MATTGFVVAELAATAFFVQAVLVVRAPRSDWSRWFAITLLTIGAYEFCDGLSVATQSHTTFELLAKGSWFLAPTALIFWWMTTGKLIRANPSSLHGYLRSTATASSMMLAALVAAFGFTDEGLFAPSHRHGLLTIGACWPG